MRGLHLSRRGFLLGTAAIAGALTLGVRPAHAAVGSFTPNAFLRLDSDGTLTVFCNRSEMGQGVRSSLPVLVCDELGGSLEHMVVEQAIGDADYGDQNTDGSTSVRTQWEMLRRMAAVARTALIDAAALQWGIDPATVHISDHQARSGDLSIGIGELAAAAAERDLPHPDDVQLRPDDELVNVGTDLPLLDGHAYVTGEARFGADMILPNMLTAVIARPPRLGARVANLDDSGARAVRGVVDVLPLPTWHAPGRFNPLGGIAVIAENTWAALKGRAALRIAWSEGSHAGIDSEAEYAAMREQVDTSGSKRRKVGRADDALAASPLGHTAHYRIPHLVHAPIEPPAAVAWVTDNRCDIWAPVQAPQRTRRVVSNAIGMKKEAITVNVSFLGAAFGRKSKPDFVVEAALLSQELGVPVRVQWSRSDEIQHAYYHACSVQRLDAAWDDSGAFTAWRHRVASPSIATTYVPLLHGLQGLELDMGLLDLPLDIPNIAIESHVVKEHVRIGWMRSVYNLNHAFATQCFVDEVARERGEATPDVLKQILGPPRHLTKDEAGAKTRNYGAPLEEHPIDVGRWHAVIDRVRELSGYDGDPGEGRAFGFAAHRSFLTYAAVVVAMTRNEQGGPRVDEAWIVMDPGTILNRDRVLAQLEGAVIFGATAALYGDITLTDGVVDQSNFHDYRLLRMNETPRHIHCEILESGHAPGGVGEPGVPPVAPAIANGWAALTGERVRELPLVRFG